jgi:hypothetical protein
MEPSENKLQRDEIWKSHILKAQDFAGSAGEYCMANGLSKGNFYAHKKRLGLTRRAKSRRSKFVTVTPLHERPEKPLKAEEGRLPDPKWVAQFVIALTGKR